MDFEVYWRIEALKVAAMEQLNLVDKLDLTLLFKRAKQIYNAGYEFKMDEWQTFWKDEQPTPKTKSVTPEPVKKEEVEFKTCPKCGESVPVGFKKHSYKKDMSICGYTFPKK